MDLLLEEVTLKRVYKLKADLIRAKGEGGAFEWDTKAETGENDNLYRCSSCGFSQKMWTALCSACGEFGTSECKNSKEVISYKQPLKTDTPIIAVLPQE